MPIRRLRLSLFAATLALVPVLSALGQQSPLRSATDLSAAAVARHYPHGSIQSAEMAQNALSEVQAARSAIEVRFTAEQNACYSKFFTTSCIDDAKERKRAELEEVRAVEVDANYFMRKQRADERDRALAQKRAQDVSERAEREQRAVNSAAKRAKAEAKQDGAVSTPQGSPDPGRVARHEMKLEQMRAQEAAEAQQRAANVAAYERKVREARARQQEIARKKAEKEKAQESKAAEPQ